MPKFQEFKIDDYFSHFEKMAMNLNWLRRNAWPKLLQTLLGEKGQKAYATLSVEDSVDYDIVRSVILKS